MECCRDGCPSRRFSPLNGEALKLCQRKHQNRGHLSDQGTSARMLSSASSRKSLGGYKLLPFKNDGGHCVLGDLQFCRHFLVPFPISVLTQSCLWALRTIPSTSWLGFCSDMHCQLWNLISIEFTTGGLQSSCRNISMMINGKKQDASELIYVNKVFLFFRHCIRPVFIFCNACHKKLVIISECALCLVLVNIW